MDDFTSDDQSTAIAELKSLMADVRASERDLIAKIEVAQADYLAASPLISPLEKPQGAV